MITYAAPRADHCMWRTLCLRVIAVLCRHCWVHADLRMTEARAPEIATVWDLRNMPGNEDHHRKVTSTTRLVLGVMIEHLTAGS